jgi:hypothetical protein
VEHSKAEDLIFYRSLWERLVKDEFVPQKLIDVVRHDGGLDISELSNADLFALMEGRFTGNWCEVAFASGELLAHYSVLGLIARPAHIVAWAFTAFMAADAIKHDATDLDLQFDKFINGFCIVRDKLETDEAIEIFQRFFQPSVPANSL